MQNTEEPTDDKKILILGLDNSGKTTILNSLDSSTNLLSFLSLTPTRGLSIEQFDETEFKASVWDFGGQEQFRSNYLKGFRKHIKGTNELIFVIDVQDSDRYDLALEYLDNLLKSIDQEQLSEVEFSVFLHKYDPNLINSKGFKEIEEKIDSELIKNIINTFPENFHYKIFKTSVYSVFNRNLIIAK